MYSQCLDERGRFNYTKYYKYIYEGINSEFKANVCDIYARELANGDDSSLRVAFLYECGVRSEGIMVPLQAKKIFQEPMDADYIFESLGGKISEDDYQKLLDKYCGMRAEFVRRLKKWQKEVQEKYAKPKNTVVAKKHFHIS